MSLIYLITNNVNQKKYIGKTNKSINDRFKEHCSESKKDRSKNRPLYRAFNKYGIENFTISLLEVCEESKVYDREIYWINKFDTFKGSGYNATIGGDGKSYIDYDYLLEYYNKNCENKSLRRMAKELKVDYGLYCKFISSKGINVTRLRGTIEPRIICNETGEIFRYFVDVAEFIRKQTDSIATTYSISANISRCCNGIRLKAYGFTWSFVE